MQFISVILAVVLIAFTIGQVKSFIHVIKERKKQKLEKKNENFVNEFIEDNAQKNNAK